MMLCLDCTSVESTYRSVCAILHLSRQQIDACLEGFDFDRYADLHGGDPGYDPDYVLLNQVRARYKVTPDPDWTATCFFHLTRTLDARHFAKGIEPMSPARAEALWAALYPLVHNEMSPTVWAELRRRVETDRTKHWAQLYQSRLEHLHVHGGPFGLLVRACAFHHEALGNHDYLGIPETVQEIGLCCEAWYQIPLIKRFQRQAKPCIVRFRVQGDAKLANLGVALNYIQSSLEDVDPYVLAPSYDAKGNWITAAQIERIECPPGHIWRFKKGETNDG